jgi:hypothetical protein
VGDARPGGEQHCPLEHEVAPVRRHGQPVQQPFEDELQQQHLHVLAALARDVAQPRLHRGAEVLGCPRHTMASR